MLSSQIIATNTVSKCHFWGPIEHPVFFAKNDNTAMYQKKQGKRKESTQDSHLSQQ